MFVNAVGFIIANIFLCMILSTNTVYKPVDNFSMASDLRRCEACQGRKEVMKMGAIRGKCPSCKGIGWVNAVPEVTCKRKYNKKVRHGKVDG